jgi:hypothetical protein
MKDWSFSVAFFVIPVHSTERPCRWTLSRRAVNTRMLDSVLIDYEVFTVFSGLVTSFKWPS